MTRQMKTGSCFKVELWIQNPVDSANPSGSQSDGSGSSKIGSLAGVSSFLNSWSKDTSKSTLGDCNTMCFLSEIGILGWGRFSGNRGPYRWKTIFLILKRFHTKGYTWRWGWFEHYPHRTLMFRDFGRCDMILYRWIKQSGLTAENNRAGSWSRWVRVALLKRCEIVLGHWIGSVGSMVKIKVTGRMVGGKCVCSLFLAGWKGWQVAYGHGSLHNSAGWWVSCIWHMFRSLLWFHCWL